MLRYRTYLEPHFSFFFPFLFFFLCLHLFFFIPYSKLKHASHRTLLSYFVTQPTIHANEFYRIDISQRLLAACLNVTMLIKITKHKIYHNIYRKLIFMSRANSFVSSCTTSKLLKCAGNT